MDNPADIDAVSGMDTRAAARLQILPGPRSAARRRPAATLWQWLTGVFSNRPMYREPTPLSVQIHNAAGRQIVAIDDVGPITDLSLPPGTYTITARIGELRRSYTMCLEQGISANLTLDIATTDRR